MVQTHVLVMAFRALEPLVATRGTNVHLCVDDVLAHDGIWNGGTTTTTRRHDDGVDTATNDTIRYRVQVTGN